MEDNYGYKPSFTVVVDQDGKALEMPVQDAQEGLNAGTYKIPLNDPDGNPITANAQEAQSLLSQGFSNPSNEQFQSLLDYTKYSSTEEQLKTGLEGAAAAATFGTSTLLERAAGVDAKDMQARRETNPGTYAVGQGAGLAASLLVPGGGALKAGETIAANLVGNALPATALGRIGSFATKAAIENAVFQMGDEASKMFMSDPNQSVETAISDIGLAAALGGGLGGIAKGTGELWDITAGKKITEVLDAVNSRNSGVTKLEDDLGMELSPEVKGYLSGQKGANIGGNVIESESAAGLKLAEEMDTVRTKLNNDTLETLNRNAADIESLADESKALSGIEFKKNIENVVKDKIGPIEASYGKLENQFKKASIDALERSEAANRINQIIVDSGLMKGPNEAALRLSQKVLGQLDNQATAADLKQYAQGLREIAPYGSENYNIGKQLRNVIEDLQESTVEKAASGSALYQEFKATQNAYRQFKNVLGELNDRLHLGREAKYGKGGFLNALKDMEPEKIAKRLKLSEDSQLQTLLQKEFPELYEQVKQQEFNNVLRKSLNVERDSIDIKKLNKELFKLQPELRSQLLDEAQLAKLNKIEELKASLPKRKNPSGTAGVLNSLGKNVNAISIATGILSGNPLYAVGSWALQKGTGRIVEGGNLAMLRYLGSDVKISAKGFAGLAEYASKLIRGQKKLEKAAKGIFEPSASMPKAADVDVSKLRKIIDTSETAPEKLLELQNDSAHYAPEHATAASAALFRNVAYLSALKPKTQQLTPLSLPTVASEEQEDRYERALVIAEQPLVVMDGIKSGRLSMNDMKDLHAMHPALVENMKRTIYLNMTDATAKGDILPYQTIIGLSIFLGQPMDASLLPNAIIASQPVPLQPQQPQAQQGMPSRKNDKLTKISNQEATGAQAREANRHK